MSGREEWRLVSGWGGRYSISNLGKVATHLRLGKKGVLHSRLKLALIESPNGYLYVMFGSGLERKRLYVHRLVLIEFSGPAPAGHEAAHLNGDRRDCRLVNLKWKTRTANMADKKLHGTQWFGESAPMAKLTDKRVLRIRAGGMSDAGFARKWGLCAETIRQARLRNTWKHLP